ncbi:MAG: corrinoid protein-associated methyltransferase CpaM [Acidobacteriota bacterium]
MSTYVLMRILESAPGRYELGIRLLALGQLDKAYDRLASRIQPGHRVLDIGCGTGALALRAAGRGASVRGIDVDPRMLEIASRKAQESQLHQPIEWAEMGVAELAGERPESYDAVTSGLSFSELSEDELSYTLEQVMRILKPGGLLLVADEVRPRGVAARVIYWLVRAPLVTLTYLLTQETTHPVAGFSGKLREVGLSIVSSRHNRLRSFVELVAQKPRRGET